MSDGAYICIILSAISIELLYIAKWLQRIHEELRKR